LEWHALRLDPPAQDPVERARRAEHARKAYFARLALKGSQAASARRKAKQREAEEREAQQYEALLREGEADTK